MTITFLDEKAHETKLLHSDDITGHLNEYYQNHSAILDDDIQQSAYILFTCEDW